MSEAASMTSASLFALSLLNGAVCQNFFGDMAESMCKRPCYVSLCKTISPDPQTIQEQLEVSH